jgi:hypothetical protein
MTRDMQYQVGSPGDTYYGWNPTPLSRCHRTSLGQSEARKFTQNEQRLLAAMP